MKYAKDEIYAQAVVGLVVDIIEKLADIYRLDPPIVTFSIWREGDKKYHGRNQARDIRDKDWPTEFARLVGGVLQKIREYDPRIQFDFETDPLHLHIEFDDNSL